MNRRPYVLALFLAIAFVCGVAWAQLSGTHAQEQPNTDANKILVQGSGSANSSEKPPGTQFKLIASNAPQRSFKVVPPGKTFILTDMVYNARGVKELLTVNLAQGKLTPERLEKPYVADILLQTYLKPTETHETHLCTGYVIPSGHSVMAWTNAGLQPDQWVQVSVTGYLIDEK